MTRLPSSAGSGDELDNEDGTRPLADKEWDRWRDVFPRAEETSSVGASSVLASTGASTSAVAHEDEEQVIIDVRDADMVMAGQVRQHRVDGVATSQVADSDGTFDGVSSVEMTRDVTVTEWTTDTGNAADTTACSDTTETTGIADTGDLSSPSDRSARRDVALPADGLHGDEQWSDSGNSMPESVVVAESDVAHVVECDVEPKPELVALTDLAPTVSVVRSRRAQLLRQQDEGSLSTAEDTLDVAADTARIEHHQQVIGWQDPEDLTEPAEPEVVTLPAAVQIEDDADERAEPVEDVVALERAASTAQGATSQGEGLPDSADAGSDAHADIDCGEVAFDDAAPPMAPVVDSGPAGVRPGKKQWPGLAYRPSPRLWAGYRRPQLRGGPFSRTTRPVDDVVPVGDVVPVKQKPADRPEWADRPRYIPIGAMVPSDVNACGQMRGEFGWNPTLAQLYWANDVADGYVATVDDEIGGTFFVHPYGETATVSNVLVRKRFHYCGLGTRMMKFMLTQYPDVEFRLDATEDAKSLFRNFGFYEAGERLTFRGDPQALCGENLPIGVRPVLPLDWPAIMRLDSQGYGEGRAEFLRSAADHADEVVVGVAGFGDIRCFGVRWHDGQDHVIGPVSATSFEAMRAMIAHLARGCSGPVQLTVGHEHTRVIEWLHERGFNISQRLTHMVRPVGEPVALPDTDSWYVTGSPAFG